MLSNVTLGKSKRYQMSRQASQNISKCHVRQVKTLPNVTSGKSKRYQMSRQASQNVIKCHVRQVKTSSNVTLGKSKRYQMSCQASQNVTKCHVRQVKSESRRGNPLLPHGLHFFIRPGTRETVFTCLYPNTVQTRLSRDQRPTKPVSRLGTGRGVGGS